MTMAKGSKNVPAGAAKEREEAGEAGLVQGT